MMKGQLTISRQDWVHGLVPCPKCGMPLDRVRDHGDFLWDLDTKAYGVQGQHDRCGAEFRLYFNDSPVPPEDVRRGRRGHG